MSCRAVLSSSLMLALALCLGAASSRAQDEPEPQPEPFPGAPPKPAGFSFPMIGNGEATADLEPDFSPLTGMQNSTLGLPHINHSYWVPGIQFSSNVYSGQSGSGSGWTADNYFIGNLSLLEAWSSATLAVNYSVGGFLSTNSEQGNGSYQQLALAQNYQSGRWLLQAMDHFSYTPQSAFGFGGGTSLGIPGVGGSLGTTIPGLGGNYVPNQSIYGVGAYYNNVAALQATYALSRRASITVSGSYGLLSFVQSGLYDSRTAVGSIGYNYALSRNDTVGLVYSFSSYQFPSNPQAYGENNFSVAYGRKVTGRLALRFFIGPEITNYRIPINNSSRTTGFSTTATVTYALQRGTIAATYIHGLSSGSGVYIGSILDQATGTFSRKITKVWSGDLNFGYARNSPLETTASGFQPFSDWFVGGGVNRPIGHDFRFAVAYTATVTNYSGVGCTGASCYNTSNFSTVTVSLQWHPRPFVLP